MCRDSKAVWGRSALLKRHETYHNPEEEQFSQMITIKR